MNNDENEKYALAIGEEVDRTSALIIKEFDESRKILKKDATSFPCNAGTLVLADIRGLHTTRRLNSGYAYSIFNYYISKFDDNPVSSIRSISKDCIKGFQ